MRGNGGSGLFNPHLRNSNIYSYVTEMQSEKNTLYVPINQFDDDEAVLSDSSSVLTPDQVCESERHSKRSHSCSAALPWLLHVILLSISAFSLVVSLAITRSSGRSCISKLSEYSPGLLALSDDYQTVRFRGSFGLPSPYKGPATPEVDAKWREIEDMGVIRISEEEFHRLNASKYAVKVPPEFGGGFMALPEFVHQIHCVKMLWEQTYPDYYVEAHNWSLQDPKGFHEHIDHCADLLRQKLMCDADMTLVTYNWITNHYAPHPNFNVQHKCRNFDAAKQWTMQRQINASSLEHNYFSRPDEPIVEFNEPPFDPLASE